LYRKVKEKIVGSINPDEVAFVKQYIAKLLKRRLLSSKKI
jgi:hypothetical protein